MTLRLKGHDDKEKYPMSESEAPLSVVYMRIYISGSVVYFIAYRPP